MPPCNGKMRKLISPEITQEYRILFIKVPDIEEYHLTKIDFDSFPKIKFLNQALRHDYITPIQFQEHNNSSVTLMDKINNHSLYSLMLVQSGLTPKKGFNELTPYELKTIFNTYVEFVNFYKQDFKSNHKLAPRFSYNHDPKTTDKPSLQSIERFHAHLYLFQHDNLLINPNTTSSRLSDLLNQRNYKTYYDPSSYPLENLVIDVHTRLLHMPKQLKIIEESLNEKVKSHRGLGLNILYHGDVEFFKNAEFLCYLKEYHHTMERIFHDFLVKSVAYDGKLNVWKINKSLASKYIENLAFLRHETQVQLLELLEHIKDNPGAASKSSCTNKLIPHNLIAYKSLCYSFSIDVSNENESSFKINIFPRLFSDIGGAGLFAYNGYNAVVIDRIKEKYFSLVELEMRREFQSTFIKRIERSHKQ